MSDSAIITALTPLTSTLDPATATADDSIRNVDSTLEVEEGQILGAFGLLMAAESVASDTPDTSSNAATHVSSLVEHGSSTGPSTGTGIGTSVGTGIGTEELYRQSLVDSSAQQIFNTSSGNLEPQAGEILPVGNFNSTPIDTITPVEEVLTETDINAAELDLVDQTDALPDADLEIDDLTPEASPIAALAQPDQNGPRLTESGGSTNSSSLENTRPLVGNSTADNSGSFQDDGAQQQGSGNATLAALNAESISQEQLNDDPVRAEFSRDQGTEDDSPLLASSSSTRPADFQPGTLSLLNGSQVLPQSAQSVATAGLALSADRTAAGAQIAQTLSGFIRQGDDFAEINLSPPHLGKISVRIAMQNDQASVIVTSPMPEVREAIEASLPRLSELLSEAGLSLADASVADQGSSQQGTSTSAETSAFEEPAVDANDSTAELGTTRARGLLDAYA